MYQLGKNNSKEDFLFAQLTDGFATWNRIDLLYAFIEHNYVEHDTTKGELKYRVVKTFKLGDFLFNPDDYLNPIWWEDNGPVRD